MSEALAERQRYQFSIDLFNTVPSRVSRFCSVLSSAKGKFSNTVPCFFGWFVCDFVSILPFWIENIEMFSYWIRQLYFSCSNFWEKNNPVVFHVDCVQRRGFSSERFSWLLEWASCLLKCCQEILITYYLFHRLFMSDLVSILSVTFGPLATVAPEVILAWRTLKINAFIPAKF